MGKHKAGLHKKVSSIFDGVPIPKGNEARPAMDKSVPTYVPPAPKVSPPPQAAPPKAGGVAILPTPPQPSKPAPQPTPRTEPTVAPIKHYTLDSEEAIGSASVWSRIEAQIKQKLFTAKDGVDPKRQVAMAVIIPVLCVVVVFAWTRALKSPAGKAPKATPQVNPQVVQVTAGLDAWKWPGPFPDNARDPMRLPSYNIVEGKADLVELLLRGIVVSDDKRVATIGNRMMYEGDEVRVNKGDSVITFVICTIDKDAVEYEAEGVRWIQKVGGKVDVKTGAALN